MSAIYFHTPHLDDVKLRGSERYYMGSLTNGMMLAVLGDLTYAEEWLKPLFPADHYIQRATGAEFGRQAQTLLSIGGDAGLNVGGRRVQPWLIGLNTAWVMGNDAVRLCARLHGQCEVHCWTDSDKSWLARIIDSGLEKGVLRSEQGWEGVSALFQAPGDFPVICSYSVCEQFPNFGCLPANHPLKQRTDDERFEQYYEIPRDEAWALCLEGLKQQHGGLHITESGWDKFFFEDGTTAFNLAERARNTAKAGS
jgi:hypothetical protein